MNSKYPLGTALIAIFFALPAAAETGHVRASLLVEPASVSPNDSFWVGVHLEIDPGWHTYWINPGEAGMATKLTWLAPPNAAPSLLWPVPIRFESGGVASHGYSGEMVLLTKLRAPTQSDGNLRLAARVDWLECAETCVPGRADVSAEVPFGKSGNPRPEFAAFRQRLPRSNPRLAPRAVLIGGHIKLFWRSPKPEGNWLFFPETAGWAALPATAPTASGKAWMLDLGAAPEPIPFRLRGVLARDNAESGFQIDVPIRRGS